MVIYHENLGVLNMFKGKLTFCLVELIIIALLTTVFFTSCQKNEEISTDYIIVKINPSKHNFSDGRVEVNFLDRGYNPMVRWSKDVYSSYKEVSSEYAALGLSSGMYQLEIIRNPNPSIFEMVFLASYDTIFPRDYFPIHPGSYWIYDNSDTIICLEEYKLIGLGHRYTGISQTHGLYNDPGFPVDSVYVPSIHVSSVDRDYDFYYYSITSGSYLMRFLPIVDEEEGFSIKQWPDGRYDYEYNSLRIMSIDTSLYIEDALYENVIVAEHFNMPNLIGDRESDYDYVTKKLYFSKNIGLIKSEAYIPYRVDNIVFYDTLTISLVEFLINSN